MAGLLETYLQDIRVNHPDRLDRDEWRMIRYGLVNSAIEQNAHPNSIISEDLREKALNSQGRVIDIPVMKKGVLTVKNVRSCTIGTHENESEMVNVTWVTYAVDISMVAAQYAKNEISYQNDLAAKLILVKEAILGEIEASIHTKLDTEKSIVYNSALVPTKYPLVGNTLQVTLAQQEYFFNDIDTIQQEDEFYGEHYVIASTSLLPSVTHYINQGSGNDENLSYQFADKTYRFSNNVINGTGVNATGFIMPVGTLGMMTRVDVDAQMNHRSTTGTEWGTVSIDGIPFPMGYLYRSECSDQSALNGTGLEHLTATMVEQWSFSVDVALVTPYNSDPATNAGAIKKFEFLNV